MSGHRAVGLVVAAFQGAMAPLAAVVGHPRSVEGDDLVLGEGELPLVRLLGGAEDGPNTISLTGRDFDRGLADVTSHVGHGITLGYLHLHRQGARVRG